MQWFRLYAEFATDPKVQMMSEAMQRRYIMLLCLRSSNALLTHSNAEVAFQLRVTESEIEETKSLFIEKGFIDSDWTLLNWDKRQFRSDRDPTRAERQKRFRERNSNALRNAHVTPLDTDTDTDKELKTLSGNPDESPPSKSESLKPAAREVLDFLNVKTSSRYRPVPANLDLIVARLKEGATVAECRQVIAKKSREWGTDEKMMGFLRPKTIFNRTNFAQYQGELGGPND